MRTRQAGAEVQYGLFHSAICHLRQATSSSLVLSLSSLKQDSWSKILPSSDYLCIYDLTVVSKCGEEECWGYQTSKVKILAINLQGQEPSLGKNSQQEQSKRKTSQEAPSVPCGREWGAMSTTDHANIHSQGYALVPGMPANWWIECSQIHDSRSEAVCLRINKAPGNLMQLIYSSECNNPF